VFLNLIVELNAECNRRTFGEQNKKGNDERQAALQSTKPKRTPMAVSTRESKTTKC